MQSVPNRNQPKSVFQRRDPVTPKATSVPDGVFARERQQQIARIVEESGRARVTELAGSFGVSAVTIRKDLLVLEGKRLVIRTHGGAIALGERRPELAFEIRERLQRKEKIDIGAAAAGRVNDGESIVLDASTTALYVARHLKSREPGWHGLTVVTNSIRLASELKGRRPILRHGWNIPVSLLILGLSGIAGILMGGFVVGLLPGVYLGRSLLVLPRRHDGRVWVTMLGVQEAIASAVFATGLGLFLPR